MKWYEQLYRGKARKYVLIGLLATVLPVGTAVTVGGGIDQTIGTIIQQSDSGDE